MKLIPLLLREGKYDQVTTDASRYIINHIKNGDSHIIFSLQLKNSDPDLTKEYGFPVPISVEVTVNIKYNKRATYPFDIAGFADLDSIDMAITINPTEFPRSYSELVPELKEAIRHELEHVAQENGLRPHSEDFEDFDYQEKDMADPKFKLGKYFQLRHEIPAFVRGLYKSAKTRRMPLDVVIDTFLNDYSHRLKDDDVSKIRKVWIDYAKKNLPSAQWRAEN